MISQRRSGTTSFYLFDGLGSTTQLANSTGTVTDSYLYDSFGNILTTSGTTTNWFRYVGRLGYYYDVDVTRYYLRARIYNPGIGRFLSRDRQTDGGSTNFYRYTRNNSSNLMDPSGMITCAEACANARSDPKDANWYHDPTVDLGFTLCLPLNPKEPSETESGCICLTSSALKLPVAVQNCIKAHEAAHVVNHEVCDDPTCPTPYRPVHFKPGTTIASRECEGAAAAMSCLAGAAARTTDPTLLQAILTRFWGEYNYCIRKGGNPNQYYIPGGPM